MASVWGLLDLIWNGITWIGNLLLDLANYIIDLYEAFYSDFIFWAGSQLPTEIVDLFNTDPWYQLAETCETINYVIPVYACFGVYLSTIVMQALIRMIRWTIGFIPTIEG